MLHLYIVSLKKDIDKRNKIISILESYNIDYEFIDAIYGKELSDLVRQEHIYKSTGKILDREFPPTPGEIGCTLSHIKTYEKIVNLNIDWACILEDDVILDQRFSIFFKGFSSDNLDQDSIYILGGQEGLFESEITKSIRNFYIIGSQKFCKTIKSEGVIYRTCCYMLNIKLAKKMLNLYDGDFILADDWNYLVKNNYIKSIYISDFVAHPLDLTNSLIEHERLASEKMILDNKKNILFKINCGLTPYKSRIKKLLLKLYVLYFERKK